MTSSRSSSSSLWPTCCRQRQSALTRKYDSKAVQDIRQQLGQDAISIEQEILKAHGYSEWSSVNIDTLPVAVAFPTCTEDVSKIARLCSKYKVPMSRFPRQYVVVLPNAATTNMICSGCM